MDITSKTILTLFLCMILGPTVILKGQDITTRHSICFISDCQSPLPAEKIIRKAQNNDEGREMLFKQIEHKNDGYVFMLGDIVGKGYDSEYWKSVDQFLNNLRCNGARVYAIPGNHEYLFKPDKGIESFKARFPDQPLTGYYVRADSMAIVMLNSNFDKMTEPEKDIQQRWYHAIIDTLDMDTSVRAVIVCTHHSPFSNSKVVGSSVKVQEAFIPGFERSIKAKLFLTGHSHNLEFFGAKSNKRYLVIGGGGGIDQPLYTGKKEKYRDLIRQEVKPRFFYVVIERKAALLNITITGFSRELSPVSELKLSL